MLLIKAEFGIPKLQLLIITNLQPVERATLTSYSLSLISRELRFLRMYRLESAHTREKKALAELR